MEKGQIEQSINSIKKDVEVLKATLSDKQRLLFSMLESCDISKVDQFIKPIFDSFCTSGKLYLSSGVGIVASSRISSKSVVIITPESNLVNTYDRTLSAVCTSGAMTINSTDSTDNRLVNYLIIW